MAVSCIGIVTVFVENGTHSGLIHLVGKMLACLHTSCTCLVLCRRAGRRHCTFAIICPNVPFDHKHEIRFLPSVLLVVADGLQTTDATVEQGICPLPFFFFAFSLSFSFVLSQKKEISLCTCLYQLCTHLRVKIIVPCVSAKCNCIQFSCLENSSILLGNIPRKRVVLTIR